QSPAAAAQAPPPAVHHGYTDAVKDALDKIDLSHSVNDISKQVSTIQATASRGMMDGVPIRSKDMYNADIFGRDVGQVGRQRVYNLWSDIFR
ncbi:hypothetical protein, partial [Erwinia billingiae]|uniref:hypothetical protein n=1 Tax=Erwinia billingiae TaxID=182337 RepID=UPI001A7F07B2